MRRRRRKTNKKTFNKGDSNAASRGGSAISETRIAKVRARVKARETDLGLEVKTKASAIDLNLRDNNDRHLVVSNKTIANNLVSK